MELKKYDRARYIKTHEGHLGTVIGTFHNHKKELVKLQFKCDCQAELVLNPRDLEAV